jgi:TonB family protein
MSHSLAPALPLPRRTLVLALIIALHVTAAYFFATGLFHTALPAEEPRTAAEVLIESAPPVPPPLPHAPTWHAQHLSVQVPREPMAAAAAATQVTEEPVPVPAQLPVAALAEPQLRVLGQHRLPASEDFYPPEKRREGIQGAPIVRVCVDARGLLQAGPLLESSSGDEGLDQGALNVARHGHYARAERGGVPVANCYRFRITFQIR